MQDEEDVLVALQDGRDLLDVPDHPGLGGVVRAARIALAIVVLEAHDGLDPRLADGAETGLHVVEELLREILRVVRSQVGVEVNSGVDQRLSSCPHAAEIAHGGEIRGREEPALRVQDDVGGRRVGNGATRRVAHCRASRAAQARRPRCAHRPRCASRAAQARHPRRAAQARRPRCTSRPRHPRRAAQARRPRCTSRPRRASPAAQASRPRRASRTAAAAARPRTASARPGDDNDEKLEADTSRAAHDISVDLTQDKVVKPQACSDAHDGPS